MDVSQHGAFLKMVEHIAIYNKNRQGSIYKGCNQTYMNFNAISKGESDLRTYNYYYCYRPAGDEITRISNYNKDGYGLIAGFNWLDVVPHKHHEASVAWFNWVTDPVESPWKRALKDGKAIHILRHAKDSVKCYDGPFMPEGTPFGFVFMYHKADSAPHSMHMMIAARACVENYKYTQSWYNYVKMGYSKIRAMTLAYELGCEDKGDKYEFTTSNYVENFQFFMIDKVYNENRYINGPIIDNTRTFANCKGYQGTTMSMAATINHPSLPAFDNEKLWHEYSYRKNVKTFAFPEEVTTVKKAKVVFKKPTPIKTNVTVPKDSEEVKTILNEMNRLLDLDREEQKDR